MKNFNHVLATAKKQATKSNLLLVKKDAKIGTKDLIYKLYNYIDKHSLPLTVEELQYKIIEEDLIASFFAKDPGRQNIAEKTQIKYMEDAGLQVTVYPTQGKNAKYMKDGKVVTGTKKELNIEIAQKSLDCLVNDVHCSLKYTNEAGGAQTNQKNDIVNFIKHAKKTKGKFAAIVDGNFYTAEITMSLRDIAGSNTYVGDIHGFIKKENIRAT